MVQHGIGLSSIGKPIEVPRRFRDAKSECHDIVIQCYALTNLVKVGSNDYPAVSAVEEWEHG